MAKVAGSIWVEGNDIHYVDQFGREWYLPYYSIIKAPPAGAQGGSIWIEPSNHWLYYINEQADAVLAPYPYGDRVAPLSAQIGSLWIDNSDNQLHWITALDGSQNHNVRAHWDVAAVSAHNDAHQYAIHGDSHTDVPHNDIHSDYVHDDGHTDIQHGDAPAQNFHGDNYWDVAGNIFTDHLDTYAYMSHGDTSNNAADFSSYHYDATWNPSGTHEDITHVDYGVNHTDYNYGPSHGDQYTHQDTPHDDTHDDRHDDSPHNDIEGKNQHGDFWDGVAHTDIPHSDVPHVDVAHVDAHQDGHTDTPHNDHPILIGP